LIGSQFGFAVGAMKDQPNAWRAPADSFHMNHPTAMMVNMVKTEASMMSPCQGRSPWPVAACRFLYQWPSGRVVILRRMMDSLVLPQTRPPPSARIPKARRIRDFVRAIVLQDLEGLAPVASPSRGLGTIRKPTVSSRAGRCRLLRQACPGPSFAHRPATRNNRAWWRLARPRDPSEPSADTRGSFGP
jgi:hypothetical protein